MFQSDRTLRRSDCADCLPPAEMSARGLPAFGVYRRAPRTGLVHRVAVCARGDGGAPLLNDSCWCSRPYIADAQCHNAASEHSPLGVAPFLAVRYGLLLPVYAYMIAATTLLLGFKWRHSGAAVRNARSARGRRGKRRRGGTGGGGCTIAEVGRRWTSVMTIITMLLTGLLLRTIYLFFDPFQVFHWVPPTVLQTTLHLSTSMFFTAGLLLTKCFVTSVKFALHFRKNISGTRCLYWGVYSGCVVLILYSLTSVAMNSPGMENPAQYWDSYETMADACISMLLCGLFVYWGGKAVHLLSETLTHEKKSGGVESGGGSAGAAGGGEKRTPTSNWAKIRQRAKMVSSNAQASQRRGLVQNWIRHIFRAAIFIFLNFLIVAFYSVGKQGNDPISLFILNMFIRTSVVFAVYSMFRIAEGSEVSKVSLGRILQMCCGRYCTGCCSGCCIVKIFGGDAEYGRSRTLGGRRESSSKASARPAPSAGRKTGKSTSASAGSGSVALTIIGEERVSGKKDANGKVVAVAVAAAVTHTEQEKSEGGDVWSSVKPSSKNEMYCENPEGFIDAESGQRYWLTADGRTSWTNPRHTLINTANPLNDD